jgi:SAM-dependent methyltransferase|tara:strand:+ start:474 stop:1079 length:606 start_codon:yes stop_codon:yes gene_type:complete
MWDDRYNRPEYVYGTEPNTFLEQTFATLAPESQAQWNIACLGEGEGRNAVYLAGLGHQVTAIDQSQVGLDKAQALALERGVFIDTVCADLGQYELAPNTYDAVVLIFCHVPAAARAFMFQQIRSALKPGGYVVIEAYTPKQLGKGTGGPSDASFMYDQAMLENAFDKFNVLHSESICRNIQEGLFHTGEGEVVQFVARKPG